MRIQLSAGLCSKTRKKPGHMVIFIKKQASNRMRFPRLGLLVVLFAGFSGLIISTDSMVNPNRPQPLSSRLLVDPATFDFSRNPALLQRILTTPHGYFRFINIPFSTEVCHRFQEIISSAPYINLHGDAHIEQYAVTDLGRGLADFDDSSVGPGILDILRIGVSLHLACDMRGWPLASDQVFDTFLQGMNLPCEIPR